MRTQATELMARVVEGSEARVPHPIAAELPHLLWLYLMGIILFWVHDRHSRGFADLSFDRLDGPAGGADG